jgi:hypothetical protein
MTVTPTATPTGSTDGAEHDRHTAPGALHWWPALGPALLGALLAVRTLAGAGLAPAIGLSIAVMLGGVAYVAPRREWWTAPLLLVGPIALVASPAGTELSFNLSHAGDRFWFVITLAIAVSVGLCVAAAVCAVVDHHAVRRSAGPMAILAAVAFTVGLMALDPQPDLGRGLDAATRASLPEVTLVNFAYGLPADDLIVDVDGSERLRALFDNPSDLPHTFTIDALDVDVYVPAGRRTYVDIAIERTAAQPLSIHCAIGDHRDLGMVATLG